MRLIDADALIDALMVYTWRDEDERLIDDADEKREFIKNWMPDLPTVNQWISVKDRLPDDASDVLAYYDDGTESRIIPVNYYKGCWYDCVFDRAIDGLETGFIKYWMSLPKAPEVKQDG